MGVRGTVDRAPQEYHESRLLTDDGLALLAHVVEQRPVAADVPAGRAAALPATERLEPGPCARRRAGLPVDVDRACLDVVQEPLDLILILAEEARRQAVLHVVGLIHRLLQAGNLLHEEDRSEESRV